MKGLLYKEFMQNKTVLIMLGLTCSAISVFLGIMPFLMSDNKEENLAALLMILITLINFFILLAFQANFFQHDEYRKWAYFVASSPETATGQIGTKYLFVLLTDGMVLVWCWFFQQIANTIQREITNITGIYTLLFFSHLMISAIEIPFMIRFGTKGGNMCHTVMFVSILLIGIIYLLFGDLSCFTSIHNLYDRLIRFLNGENISGIMLTVQGLFAWIAIGSYYLSYRISCRCYLKGVEYYAK